MSGWDEGAVYYSNQGEVADRHDLDDAGTSLLRDRFLRFIREFREGTNAFIYRYLYTFVDNKISIK